MLVAMFAFLLLGQSASAQSCSADFNAVIDGPDVTFDGIATGVSPAYVWDFGDGSYAYTENPEHTYDADGWYLVCFYVYGADSCFASQCDTIAITGAGGGDCYAYFSLGYFGDLISFNNLSTPGAVESYWSFGDGTTSVADDPMHAYEPGTYTVCLTIYGVDSCTDEYCQTITIFGGGDTTGCSAYFAFSEAGGMVDFDNLSYTDGFDASYVWEFGDGTTSLVDNPMHAYDDGIYTACLTMYTDDSCSSTYCATLYIGGGIDTGSCYADFDVDFDGLLADFNNNSMAFGGDIISNYWTFGDGGISGAPNPNHDYATEGVYEVCLTIFTSDSCSSTYCETIYVGGIIDSGFCAADFEVDISGTLAEFTNTSTGGFADITGYSWSFGDGETSIAENPNHNYDFPGTYTVCLTIYTTDSCVSTYCDFVMISGIDDTTDCNAAFNYDFGITPWGIFTTNDSYDGGAAAIYLWEFGDGTSSTEFEPNHEYAAGGTYLICLTITTAFCTDTQCDTVVIAPTGIDEETIIGVLNAYPNPANDLINITLENAITANTSIVINDLSGKQLKEIFTGTLYSGQHNFQTNINVLPEGIYLIHVISDAGGVQVIKFIKQ